MEMGFASVQKENIDLVTHEVVGSVLKAVRRTPSKVGRLDA